MFGRAKENGRGSALIPWVQEGVVACKVGLDRGREQAEDY